MQLNNSTLHYVVVDTMLERGWAPSAQELSERFGVDRRQIRKALDDLAEYHGVVLHPGSDEIWVVHPFSTAPTGFLVRAGEMEWWGNCAWCSLGIAELAGRTATITTALGAAGRQVTVRISDGEVLDKDFVIHFPIKMVNAWDNVLFTCSMMLLFEDEAQVDQWCREARQDQRRCPADRAESGDFRCRMVRSSPRSELGKMDTRPSFRHLRTPWTYRPDMGNSGWWQSILVGWLVGDEP